MGLAAVIVFAEKVGRGRTSRILARLALLAAFAFPQIGCVVTEYPLIPVEDQKPIAYAPAVHGRVRVFYGDMTSADVKGGNTDEHLTLSFDEDLAALFDKRRPPVHSINMTASEFSNAVATAAPIEDTYKEYVVPAGAIVRVAQKLKIHTSLHSIRTCEPPARSILLSAGDEVEFKLITNFDKCLTLVRRYSATAHKWEIVPAAEKQQGVQQKTI